MGIRISMESGDFGLRTRNGQSLTTSATKFGRSRGRAIRQSILVSVLGLVGCLAQSAFSADLPGYQKDIQPLLTRYCAGCHNADDANGELVLTSFETLLRGGESGPAITPSSSASSRLAGMLLGKLEPVMPPEDEPRPTRDEIELILRWIDGGAISPNGDVTSAVLRVPSLGRSRLASPITCLDYDPSGTLLAAGRFQQVDLLGRDGKELLGALSQHPGKVNDVRFSSDGRYLIVATGIAGLSGEAWLWDVERREKIAVFGGHHDVLYAAELSPDGQWVATGGYDRAVRIHRRETGDVAQVLTEHNGAVFDLAFSPNSRLLFTGSADTTVKVWNVATGQRLDTRAEPLKEVLATAVHPSGEWFVGAGADNKIRMWRLESLETPRINPALHARFAHEGAIERLRYSRNGEYLVSVARDRLVKIWDAETLREVAVLPQQPAAVQAIAVAPDGQHVTVGRMNGTLESYAVVPKKLRSATDRHAESAQSVSTAPTGELTEYVEAEPNGDIAHAQQIELPASVRGVIDPNGDLQEGAVREDEDLYRFAGRRGERWIFEVDAARSKSPLDSHLEILDEQRDPIPRILLQAVRDSYHTFKGKNSTEFGAFRLHNWEEMRMNQLLYCNGELVRLYHYPRGPDSGFSLYPNRGSRHTFFDTTAITHPLHESCYIVEPHLPGTELVANGLPVFTVYYANDDDAKRELGSDSRLTFDVPDDGTYFVRLRDARGFGDSDYKYQLNVRIPQPRFTIGSVSGENPAIPRGNGIAFEVKIDRHDGFDGAVRVDVTNVPDGFHVTAPLLIEPSQFFAVGRIWCDADAEEPAEDAEPMQLVASSDGGGNPITLEPRDFGKPTVKDPSKLVVHLTPFEDEAVVNPPNWPVLEIRRGMSATARLRVERSEFEERITFGDHQSAQNAPFGVYVDNIGLSGVLMPEGTTERKVFLRADEVTVPGERLIFFKTDVGGSATSNPMILRVIE